MGFVDQWHCLDSAGHAFGSLRQERGRVLAHVQSGLGLRAQTLSNGAQARGLCKALLLVDHLFDPADCFRRFVLVAPFILRVEGAPEVGGFAAFPGCAFMHHCAQRTQGSM